MNKNGVEYSELKELIIKILDATYLMSLATHDDKGLWVSDVIFVFDDDLNIYWLSQPNTRHSLALKKNSQIAVSITTNTKQGEDNIGVQISGHAYELDGNILPMAEKHLAKRNKAEHDPTQILTHSQRWYKLTPEYIDVIYEPLWGFEKKSLELGK